MNEATRNVQVQATLANPGGKLRPGMFVQVEMVFGADRSVIAIPTTAINYAPYGDSVYIVSDLKDPEPARRTAEFVSSLSSLKAHAAIRLRWSRVSSPVTKL